MTIRAKFCVSEVREHSWSKTGRTVVLEPRYDSTIPEDVRYASATPPSGRLEMFVDNPAAIAQLLLGTQVYLDLTPAPADA